MDSFPKHWKKINIVFTDSKIKKRCRGRRYIDGHTYVIHSMKGNPPRTYLVCTYYRRRKCRGRGVLSADGTEFCMKFAHNHPANYDMEKKIFFLNEIKKLTCLFPEFSPLNIYGKAMTLYVQCCKARKLGCRGRAVIDMRSRATTILHDHNHPCDTNEDHILNFLNAIKQVLKTRKYSDLKQVYEAVESKHPIGASLRPYESIRCSMMRWRQQVLSRTRL